MATKQVGLIGFGYWGPNLARAIQATPGLRLSAVAETDDERADLAWKLHGPHMRAGALEIMAHDDIEAVVVATPVQTHYQLVKSALAKGKHVLVAKPLAHNQALASQLTQDADMGDLVLMTDHTFVYTGAVQAIRENVASLGDLRYFRSTRVNLGIFRQDTDVIWDLAAHDFSILFEAIGHAAVDEVRVTAKDCTGLGRNDAAWIQAYVGDMIADIHVNWISPVKVRQTIIGGSQGTLIYDDVEPSEKVKIYESAVVADEGAARASYRLGQSRSPVLDTREALAVEMEEFECRMRGLAPLYTDHGEDIVAVLETCDRALLTGEWEKVW